MTYKTAWRRYKAGTLDTYQTPTGMVVVRDLQSEQPVEWQAEWEDSDLSYESEDVEIMTHHHPEQIPLIYERHALTWDTDRRRGTWNDKNWHDRFIACLPPGARVLDLGCGSGVPVAFHLVQHGLHVTGVDTSPTLITLCRQRMPEHEWIVAAMQALALPQRFNGLLSWDSFFHLTPEHQRTMFTVFAAHAAPGAFLLFNTGPRQGESLGDYQGEALYHASLDPEEYQQLLDQSGFTLVAHTLEDPTAGGRTIWLAQSQGPSE